VAVLGGLSQRLGRGLRCGVLFLLIALLSQEKLWGATVDIYLQFHIFSEFESVVLDLDLTAFVRKSRGGCLLHTEHRTRRGTAWFVQILS